MKLISLAPQVQVTKADFIVQFNQDVELKKNSKIGLLNLSVSLNNAQTLSVSDVLRVELVNVPIESMNGKTGRVENILQVLPSLEKQGLNIVYQNQTPVMLDLNNAEPMLLSNIHVKVLKSDGTSLAVDSEQTQPITLTILVD